MIHRGFTGHACRPHEKSGLSWHRTGKFVCSFALFISGQRSLACRTFVLVSPLTGESLSLACPRESNQREGHPDIRPRLRRGSLVPSPLQGHAVKGHPWPITALAPSMSLNPFHGDSTRPPEGGFGVVCENVRQEQKPNATDFDLPEMSQARDLVPFRRPSGGVAQGDEPHGCGERLNGPGTAHVSRPPEQRRSEGSFA